MTTRGLVLLLSLLTFAAAAAPPHRYRQVLPRGRYVVPHAAPYRVYRGPVVRYRGAPRVVRVVRPRWTPRPRVVWVQPAPPPIVYVDPPLVRVPVQRDEAHEWEVQEWPAEEQYHHEEAVEPHGFVEPGAPDVEAGEAPAEPDACPLTRRFEAESPSTAEPGPGEHPMPADGEDPLSQLEDAIVNLTNRERAAEGLPALRSHDALRRAAAGHSQEMASLGYFSHSSPTAGRKSTVDRLRIEGVSTFESAAENIAMGTFDPGEEAEAFVRMWMNSPGHRANIMNPQLRLIGVGVAVDAKGQLVATQVFTAVAGQREAEGAAEI